MESFLLSLGASVEKEVRIEEMGKMFKLMKSSTQSKGDELFNTEGKLSKCVFLMNRSFISFVERTESIMGFRKKIIFFSHFPLQTDAFCTYSVFRQY